MAKGGLEGVVVTDSSITFLDGQAGVLAYRGYQIEELVEKCSFEEVAHLLWYGELPYDQARRGLHRRTECPPRHADGTRRGHYLGGVRDRRSQDRGAAPGGCAYSGQSGADRGGRPGCVGAQGTYWIGVLQNRMNTVAS